jgi:hypothetical protein
MKKRKLINTIAAGVIITCCGLTALLFSSNNEGGETERQAISATQERRSQESQSTATRKPTATPLSQVKINAPSADIRSGPGTNYPSIDFALEDETFAVVASNNAKDWYIIALDNDEFGWIAASVVTVVNSLTLIQVAETIPAPPADQPTTSTQATQPPIPQPIPQPTAPPPPPVCNCSGDLYNCGSFNSSGQAQACYNYCVEQGRGDIHRLDRDNDGLVCEG